MKQNLNQSQNLQRTFFRFKHVFRAFRISFSLMAPNQSKEHQNQIRNFGCTWKHVQIKITFNSTTQSIRKKSWPKTWFSIFDKLFHTDITIHNRSVHPHQHKFAAFTNMHQLVSINQSQDDFNNELNTIRQIDR